MKKSNFVFTAGIFFLLSVFVFAEDVVVESPDSKVKVTVSLEDAVYWSVEVNEDKILKKSPLSMKFTDEVIPGDGYKLTNKVINKIDDKIETVVGQKSKYVKDVCNELKLDFEQDYSIVFRVYDNGCAYRFETSFDGDLQVYNDNVVFKFADNYKVHFPEVEENLISHYESAFDYVDLNSIPSEKTGQPPFLIEADNGIKVAVTESGVYDYPCMFLKRTGENTLTGIFPKVVLEVEDVRDRKEEIKKEAAYIAEVKGTRAFPWRILMISEQDKELLENQLVFLLSDPNKLEDTDWIKPGKVAWDWWNANNIFGVDFESGINTETYKYYIDFASKFGLEYIILDEGWSKTSTDILSSKEDINIEELISYGKEKNVGIILWVLWKPLSRNLEEILDQYAAWGVKGVKVDFMQRADQWMVNYYEQVSIESAERHLLVDFHGAFKPCGLNRVYPNYLTGEGVKGLENDKWSDEITPEHDLTLPFTRMLAGAMDYTPGAMVNKRSENFYASFDRPMSQGTRAHQAAMYVVYESPLQMFADSPSRYLRDEKYTGFVSKFPAVWDTTIVLAAAVSDYIITAREKDGVWYLGGMTDGSARDLSIDLSFLDEGGYEMEILQDGINAAKFAEDYKLYKKEVSNESTIEIHFAPGGGWAAIINKK